MVSENEQLVMLGLFLENPLCMSCVHKGKSFLCMVINKEYPMAMSCAEYDPQPKLDPRFYDFTLPNFLPPLLHFLNYEKKKQQSDIDIPNTLTEDDL